jgi:hypothetical protein
MRAGEKIREVVRPRDEYDRTDLGAGSSLGPGSFQDKSGVREKSRSGGVAGEATLLLRGTIEAPERPRFFSNAVGSSFAA